MNSIRRLILIFCLLFCCLCLEASIPSKKDLQPLCDSLSIRLKERMNVDMPLAINRISSRGKVLHLYFNAELSYYPWRKGDPEWFQTQVLKYWDDVAAGYSLGQIYTNRYSLPELVIPDSGNDGSFANYKHAISDPKKDRRPLVRRIGANTYARGLDGRYIALWQSHGRYYNEENDVWQWQRALLFRTVEDMFTQSFVLPFLMPMLENAGAYILCPRERDIQPHEYIIDNDPAFEGERIGLLRRSGQYSEDGDWQNAGNGFADYLKTYTFSDLPFEAGSARSADCSGSKANSSAVWAAEIEHSGEYAVYVSYKSLSNSNKSAHYSIHHASGVSEFEVDQTRSGQTWLYLGTFPFKAGAQARVVLDNRGELGTIVSADAVKIGGGMGKMERGGKTSGMASSYEGAHYWMHWAGCDSTITRNWDRDYTNDYAARGLWTMMMREKKNVPIDLSLAFHSDAGLFPNDSIVGTLAIYTLRSDGERELSDGRDRIISRLLCDYVQTQIVNDIRADFEPEWQRRGLWDKSYSESRTTGVPAMILELLSHQNFADMKYGHDPAFKFSVSRAVYKGVLKSLSAYYGCPYTVQPLPVHSFSSRLLDDGRVRLDWQPQIDSLEPTALSDSYIVYTRIDDGFFDQGVETNSPFIEMRLDKGHIYSFKVEAQNAGGRSFPSEILSVGMPLEARSESPVLIVNNFDRVSAPYSYDTPTLAGFDAKKDSGVPYIRDISYIGEEYEHDRSKEYVDDYYSGFGSTYDDFAGLSIAGNTFDYPYIHGKALFELGYPFISMSRDAFCLSTDYSNASILDLICGKQAKTRVGRGAVPDRHEVFPLMLKKAIDDFQTKGGDILLSGSNIASDCDSLTLDFVASAFGYKFGTTMGTSSGIIEGMPFSNSPNSLIYSVESPDGILPSNDASGVWLRYPRSSFGAAIYQSRNNIKSVSIGVPIETLINESDRLRVIEAALDFFRSEEPKPHTLSH